MTTVYSTAPRDLHPLADLAIAPEIPASRDPSPHGLDAGLLGRNDQRFRYNVGEQRGDDEREESLRWKQRSDKAFHGGAPVFRVKRKRLAGVDFCWVGRGLMAQDQRSRPGCGRRSCGNRRSLFRPDWTAPARPVKQ